MDYRKKLVVEPGSTVRWSEIDASYAANTIYGKHKGHEQALPEIQAHVKRMGELQYLLYADNDQSLLVVLQGLDKPEDVFARRLRPHQESRDQTLGDVIQPVEQVR